MSKKGLYRLPCKTLPDTDVLHFLCFYFAGIMNSIYSSILHYCRQNHLGMCEEKCTLQIILRCRNDTALYSTHLHWYGLFMFVTFLSWYYDLKFPISMLLTGIFCCAFSLYISNFAEILFYFFTFLFLSFILFWVIFCEAAENVDVFSSTYLIFLVLYFSTLYVVDNVESSIDTIVVKAPGCTKAQEYA